MAIAMAVGVGTAVPPAAAQLATHTVEAPEEWVFVSLAELGLVVEVSDPSVSPAWDVAFLGTEVMLNGSGAGVGAVCLCQNQWVTNAQIQEMTPDSELPEFLAVTAESIAPNTEWHPSTFAAFPWFKYNLGGEHMIWPTYNTYLIKRGDTVYKFQIAGYYSAAGDPRHITFRYDRIAG